MDQILGAGHDTNYPATVSEFYLDKYETTVGRQDTSTREVFHKQLLPAASDEEE